MTKKNPIGRPKGELKRSRNISIPIAIDVILEKAAKKQDKSCSAIIVDAIKFYLNN
ncbi:MAG: hypothetical protein RRZ64_08970 [Rikenellaceae bacterium]